MDMTVKYLETLLRSDMRNYYGDPSLNEILYLHFKGFEKIENLEPFTSLRILHLECNSLSSIQGLDSLVTLRKLYLH